MAGQIMRKDLEAGPDLIHRKDTIRRDQTMGGSEGCDHGNRSNTE